MTEKVLGSLQIDFVLSLFGALDSHTDTIEKAFNVRIAAGENGIVITGENADNVQMAATVIDLLAGGAAKGRSVLADAPRRTRDEYSALWRDILAQPGEG